jgi:hypothetical protein
MPYVSWISLVIVAAVAAAWSVIGLTWHRRGQRRREREDAWARFAHGHRELDRDLDRTWHHK